MNYLLDSCAILSFLLGEPEGSKVRDMFQDPDNVFFLNYVNYGEVLFILGKQNFNQSSYQKVKIFLKNKLRITFISTDTFELTELAADYKILGGVSYFDSLILSSSQKHNLTILTKDQEFQKFSKTHRIKFL